MNHFRICCGLAFLTLLLLGCGGETPPVAEKVVPDKDTQPKAAPVVVPVAAPVPKTPSQPKTVAKLRSNPFQMPDVPEESLPVKEEPKPEETAAPVKQLERPRLRLLGFSNVEGFKALVEVKGDVQAVAAGDTIEGAQVVSIEPPIVTFQYASARWATKLFEQPWHNEQTGLATSPGASRPFASQTRSTPRSTAPSYATRTPVASNMRGQAGPDMLGTSMGSPLPAVGGNSATPSIPGMPATSGGGSGIPGMGSIPGMPSAGAAGANGMPGLPGMPSGAGAMPGGAGAMPGGAGAMPGGAGAMPGGAGAMPGGAGAMPGGAGAMPGGAGAMPGGIN